MVFIYLEHLDFPCQQFRVVWRILDLHHFAGQERGGPQAGTIGKNKSRIYYRLSKVDISQAITYVKLMNIKIQSAVSKSSQTGGAFLDMVPYHFLHVQDSVLRSYRPWECRYNVSEIIARDACEITVASTMNFTRHLNMIGSGRKQEKLQWISYFHCSYSGT